MKSKLFFGNLKSDKTLKLLFQIYSKIYENSENYNVHSHALPLLFNFLRETQFSYYKLPEFKSNYLNHILLFQNYFPDLKEAMKNVLKSYVKIDGEEFKFKYVDLLKSEKELEKITSDLIRFFRNNTYVEYEDYAEIVKTRINSILY